MHKGKKSHKVKKTKHKHSKIVQAKTQEPVQSVEDGNTFIFAHSTLDSLLEYSRNYLGCSYHRGSAGPSSFDCAGFVHFLFRHSGTVLPRDARAQALLGVNIAKDEIQPGDLLFFRGRSASSNRIGHVALAIERIDDKVFFIHASTRGIVIDQLDSLEYYKKRFLFSKRILNTSFPTASVQGTPRYLAAH
ncbi:MAG: C40 family peptidase [Ignavibacteria bacterium]|nr:C40 family peptidase [Ignavibacteria bacterium]